MSQQTTHPFDAHTGALVTAVGAAYPGERAVFRGRDVHHEVMQEIDWLGLLARGVGVELTPEQVELLGAFFISTSYPDARIWNNRVAALAGSTRSTSALALGAANAVSEASIYGRRTDHKASAFLWRTHAAMQDGVTLADCVEEHLSTRGKLLGYGRPIFNGDERIAPLMATAQNLGFDQGPHVKLAFAVEEYLASTGRHLKINVAALGAAFGADFGMTPLQWSMMLFPIFLAGMTPCYLEALEKPIGAVFAARCDQVQYTGPSARIWPAELDEDFHLT